MLLCDTLLFTGLIRPLQLSQLVEGIYPLLVLQGNENALPWCSQVFSSPQVFLPFLQIQPVSAPSLQRKLSHCIFLLIRTSHFRSTLSNIFHLFSQSVLPLISPSTQVPQLLCSFIQFHCLLFNVFFSIPSSADWFIQSHLLNASPKIYPSFSRVFHIFQVRSLYCAACLLCPCCLQQAQAAVKSRRERCPLFISSACP